MKKLMFSMAMASALGLLILAPAMAQGRADGRPDRGQNLERRVEFLDRTLDLTDAQQEQLLEHMTSQREKRREWMQSHPDASREERMAYMSDQRKAGQESLSKILTPEQQQKLEAAREKGNAAGFGKGKADAGQKGKAAGRAKGKAAGREKGNRDGRQNGMRGGGFVERLNLTDAQREQVEGIMKSQRDAMQSWRAAHPDATREELTAQRQAHFEAMKSALKDVLTPEQLEQLEAFHADGARQMGARGDGHRGRHR